VPTCHIYENQESGWAFRAGRARPFWWFRHLDARDHLFSGASQERNEVTAANRDPYQVLGLSSSASQSEITSAYRRLLREHHPDTRTRPRSSNPAADEHLQRILSAYALLRDPEHRAAHDRAVTERAEAESDVQPRRRPEAPTRPATPIRIRVVVRGTPPPQGPPATGLWVSPVQWHR